MRRSSYRVRGDTVATIRTGSCGGTSSSTTSWALRAHSALPCARASRFPRSSCSTGAASGCGPRKVRWMRGPWSFALVPTIDGIGRLSYRRVVWPSSTLARRPAVAGVVGDSRPAGVRRLRHGACATAGVDPPELPAAMPFEPAAPERLDLDGFGVVVHTSGFRPDYKTWIRVDAFDEMG